MKRKIILGIIVIVSLFTITGCNKNTSKDNNESSKLKEITIGDKKIQLDKKDNYNNKVEYAYSSSFNISSLGTNRIYKLLDKDENELLAIYTNTTYETPEQTLSMLEKDYYNNNTINVKSSNKTINDMDCTYIEYNNTTKGIDYVNHEYYYLFDKEENNYFYIKIKTNKSIEDYKELEDELINNVVLK